MSQNPMPTGRPEKTMSSRLMTMKFMQRAAASSPVTSSQTPSTSNGAPPSKRRKTSNTQSPLTQSPLPVTPTTDAQIFQAAVDAEEAKRVAAIEKFAAQAGETKWVFSTADGVGEQGSGAKKLQFHTAGYSDIDQDIETRGRRTFGRYTNEQEQQDGTAKSDAASSSSDEGEDNDEDDDTDGEDDDNGTVARNIDPPEKKIIYRAEDDTQALRKGKNARKIDASSAGMRRKNDVKLNKLTSISGGGGARGGGGGLAGMECHFCGEKGHKKADCPKKLRLKSRREDR